MRNVTSKPFSLLRPRCKWASWFYMVPLCWVSSRVQRAASGLERFRFLLPFLLPLINPNQACCEFCVGCNKESSLGLGSGWEAAGVPAPLTLGASCPSALPWAGERARTCRGACVVECPACGRSARQREHCVQIRLHLSHRADVRRSVPLDCIITELNVEPNGCSLFRCCVSAIVSSS